MEVTNEMIEAAALRWATMDRKRDRFLDDKAGKLGDLDGCYEGYMAEAKEILTAALAVAPGVEVKPLEWEWLDGDGMTCWIANGLGRIYEAGVDAEGNAYWGLFRVLKKAEDADTLEAAKSAAQADYTARIMSALATTETNGHE